MIIFIHHYACMENNLVKWRETLNEYTVLFLTYVLMCFTDYVPSATTRSELGLFYIFISLSNIGTHLLFMIGHSFVTIKNACKRRFCMKKQLDKKNKVKPDNKQDSNNSANQNNNSQSNEQDIT